MTSRFLLIAALLQPFRAGAQWHVALLGGTATTQGDSRDATDPEHAEIRADRIGTVTVAVARDLGSWRASAGLRHAGADLSEVTPSASIVARGVLSAWGAALSVGHRVTGGSGPSLWVVLGADADRWTFDLAGSTPRWRVAVYGGLESDFPIGRGWAAIVRADLTAGPSIFRGDEVPEGFTRRMAVRQGYALGIARRWR